MAPSRSAYHDCRNSKIAGEAFDFPVAVAGGVEAAAAAFFAGRFGLAVDFGAAGFGFGEGALGRGGFGLFCGVSGIGSGLVGWTCAEPIRTPSYYRHLNPVEVTNTGQMFNFSYRSCLRR